MDHGAVANGNGETVETSTTYVHDETWKGWLAVGAGAGMMAICGISALALRVPEWSAAVLTEAQVIGAATLPEKIMAWQVVVGLLVLTVAALPAAVWLLVLRLAGRTRREWREGAPAVRVFEPGQPAARALDQGRPAAVRFAAAKRNELEGVPKEYRR